MFTTKVLYTISFICADPTFYPLAEFRRNGFPAARSLEREQKAWWDIILTSHPLVQESVSNLF